MAKPVHHCQDGLEMLEGGGGGGGRGQNQKQSITRWFNLYKGGRLAELHYPMYVGASSPKWLWRFPKGGGDKPAYQLPSLKGGGVKVSSIHHYTWVDGANSSDWVEKKSSDVYYCHVGGWC